MFGDRVCGVDLPPEAGTTILSYIAHGLNLVACYLGLNLPLRMDFGHPRSYKTDRQIRYPLLRPGETAERARDVFVNVLFLCSMMKIRGLGLNPSELLAYTAALYTHPKLGRYGPGLYPASRRPSLPPPLATATTTAATSVATLATATTTTTSMSTAAPPATSRAPSGDDEDDWQVIEVPNVPKTSEVRPHPQQQDEM